MTKVFRMNIGSSYDPDFYYYVGSDSSFYQINFWDRTIKESDHTEQELIDKKAEELGYWVDYINNSYKIIIEFDEPMHYYGTEDGSLREKDVVRQKEIESYFKEYKFIRVRQTNLTDEYAYLMDQLKDQLVQ